MGRPRNEIDPEDIRLIRALKEERERLKEELANMPANRSRMIGYRERAWKINEDLDQLSNKSIAEKFELDYWTVSKL